MDIRVVCTYLTFLPDRISSWFIPKQFEYCLAKEKTKTTPEIIFRMQNLFLCEKECSRVPLEFSVIYFQTFNNLQSPQTSVMNSIGQPKE